MTCYVALLRAVNVGGTGKLAMSDLKTLCEAVGFACVRTYIASGNVIFTSRLAEPSVKKILERTLHEHTGMPVGVLVRTSAEMARILAANPFPHAPGNRVVAIFLDDAAPIDALHGVRHQTDERIPREAREIYVHYGDGMAHSRLVIPAAKAGTARNMKTIARLTEMAATPWTGTVRGKSRAT